MREFNYGFSTCTVWQTRHPDLRINMLTAWNTPTAGRGYKVIELTGGIIRQMGTHKE